MIGRSFRFHGHGSLRGVYSHGKISRGAHSALRYAAGRRRSWRAAVVVSKKISKSAVERNRIRRRIYEIVRLSMPPDAPPHDLIFTVYSDWPLNAPHDQLVAEVLMHLECAGLISSPPTK